MSAFNILILLCVLGTALAGKQCMSVIGQVKCGTRPPDKPVFIKLFDEDAGGPDDWMDDGYASKSGYFHLHGCASDPLGMTIDPMIRIYHNCKGEGYRRTLVIPKESVKVGKYKFPQAIDLNSVDETDVKHKYDVAPCSKLEKTTGRP